MKIYIRNMVCNRCILAVRNALVEAGMSVKSLTLGEAELEEEPSSEALRELGTTLKAMGFEIIDDRKGRIIEKIKSTIITLVHHTDDLPHYNLSELLSKELHYEYSSLSNMFSLIEDKTIEQFFIAQKTERVKELLMYDELSLSQIADRLGYSSVAHLSNQFKKQTGLAPSFFKRQSINRRRNLDEV